MTAAACRSSECERARTFFGGGEKHLLRTRSKRESELYNFFGGEFAGFEDFFSHPRKKSLLRHPRWSGAGVFFLAFAPISTKALGLANQVVMPFQFPNNVSLVGGVLATPKDSVNFRQFPQQIGEFGSCIRPAKSATFWRRHYSLDPLKFPQMRHRLQSRPAESCAPPQSQFCDLYGVVKQLRPPPATRHDPRGLYRHEHEDKIRRIHPAHALVMLFGERSRA